MGFATAATVWVIWYYTKISCTPANALDYQCNPSAIARYIDAEILGRCITLGAIVATLVGGLNIYMFVKEREARIAAENRLAEERQSKDELLEEWRAERQQWQEQLAEERRRADEHAAEQRRVADANQQVLLTTIADLTERITELAARNHGNGSANEP